MSRFPDRSTRSGWRGGARPTYARPTSQLPAGSRYPPEERTAALQRLEPYKLQVEGFGESWNVNRALDDGKVEDLKKAFGYSDQNIEAIRRGERLPGVADVNIAGIPEPSREGSSADRHIADLEKQASEAQEIREKRSVGGHPLPPEHPAAPGGELEREETTARAKAGILRSYRDAKLKPPEELELLVSDKLSPYLSFDKDGSYSIDIIRALKAGVSEKELVKLGYTEDSITKMKDFAESVKKESPARYKVLVNEGIDAYNKAAAGQILESQISIRQEKQREADFEGNNTQLPDGLWVSNKEMERVKKETPRLYEILVSQGYNAYKDEFERPAKEKKAIEESGVAYHEARYQALEQDFLSRPETDQKKYVKTILGKEGVKSLQDKGLPISYDSLGPIGKKAVLFNWEKKKEKETEPISPASWLGVAVPAAEAEPTPIGEIAILTALIAVGIYNKIRGLTKKDLNKAVSQYRATTGQNPTADDILIVDKTGKVASLAELQQFVRMPQKPGRITTFPLTAPDTVKLPGTTKVEYQRGQEGFSPAPRRAPQGGFTRLQPGELGGHLIDWKEPVVFLPGTKFPIPERLIRDKSTLAERHGLLLSAAQEAIRAAPKTATRTIEVNWNELLRQGQQQRINNAFRVLNETVRRQQAAGKVIPDVSRAYWRLYQEYLARKAAYEAARRAYIESLNPEPIHGHVTDDMLNAYADYVAATSLTKGKAKARIKAQLLQQTATRAATWAYAQALQQGQTATQAQAAAQTAAQTAVQTATKTQTQTQTKTQTRTQTRTAVRTAVREAVRETTAEIAPAIPIEITAELSPTRPFPLPGGGTDEQKRKRIKGSGGALCWRQGEVSGKGGGREDVWHVIVSPFIGKSDHLVVVGKRPVGAKVIRGPQSAYRTAQYLYGMGLSQEVKHDIGLFDAHLTPISEGSGLKITFEHDPSISGTASPITRTGNVFPLERNKRLRLI